MAATTSTTVRRLAPAVAGLALGALLLAGCGGSAPKGPPSLVFVSTRDGDYALFGADASGKHARRLTKEEGNASTPERLFFQVDPSWSPGGQLIAFASRRDGLSHIYVMRWDGTGTRRVTSGDKEDEHPAWSPDGRRILFAREGALFAVPARGGTARRVGRGRGNAADPAWSPDGRLIAYDYRQPGSLVREIWTMRADGGGARKLTKLRGVSREPAWSPDGRRIAFESDTGNGRYEIYTIRVDGKGLRQVTRSLSDDAFQPAWSPEGTMLAFSRGGALWVDADGTQTQITSERDNDLSPAWRPLQRR